MAGRDCNNKSTALIGNVFILFFLLKLRNINDLVINIYCFYHFSGNSGTSTSASTSTSMMFNDDKDEVLSDILDGLIDFQERSPTVSNTTGSSSMSAAASNNPQVIAASRADERRISDIERFLASSEHSLLQQQVLQQHQVI